MRPGTKPGICSYSAPAAAADASVIQADRKPTQRTVRLCVVPPGPLPASIPSATEPEAAPALISPLQTATLTGSAAPKASPSGTPPPSAHLHGSKTLSASVCSPSERKGIQGERGRLSPPSFTPHLHPAHTHSTDPIIYG